MNDQQSLLEVPRIPRKTSLQFNPKEFKVISLRECPVDTPMCDTPDKAAAYWREAIANDRYYDPERECFVIVMLNTRRRIKGHNLVSIGTHDTLLVHPVSVFRPAVTLSCAAIILMHSHPSGVMPHPVLCRMAPDLPCFSWVKPFPNAA